MRLTGRASQKAMLSCLYRARHACCTAVSLLGRLCGRTDRMRGSCLRAEARLRNAGAAEEAGWQNHVGSQPPSGHAGPCTMVDDVLQVGGKQPRVQSVANGAQPHDAIPAGLHRRWTENSL